jgi:hypothetical protein
MINPTFKLFLPIISYNKSKDSKLTTIDHRTMNPKNIKNNLLVFDMLSSDMIPAGKYLSAKF